MRTRTERNKYGPGWGLWVYPFGRPNGTRAHTFPWYSHNIHDPAWRRTAWVSYIPGYVLEIIWRAKVYQRPGSGSRKRRLWATWTRNGNTPGFPGWW